LDRHLAFFKVIQNGIRVFTRALDPSLEDFGPELPDNFAATSLQFYRYYLLFLALANNLKMFFIGGINSVLPYIIYLSLIWVFVIVGFSGKVLQARQLLSSRVYHAQKQDLRLYDQKVIHLYEHIGTISKPSVTKSITLNPASCFFPSFIQTERLVTQTYLTVNQQYYSDFSLRGPPAFPFIS
jgi:hypothetical protein